MYALANGAPPAPQPPAPLRDPFDPEKYSEKFIKIIRPFVKLKKGTQEKKRYLGRPSNTIQHDFAVIEAHVSFSNAAKSGTL